jgi:MoaA/NifB/PqqE/SkfB family radical SAM enzyme
LDYCPFIKKPIDLKTFEEEKSSRLKNILIQIKQKKIHLETNPLHVSLSHSGTCNLRCKMCLSHADFNPSEPLLDELVVNKILPDLIPDLEVIQLCGNGELFAQRETLNLIKNFDSSKYPHVRFALLTNGLLLDKSNWKYIQHNRFESVNVSVDASCKETYEKIRKGGRWETVQSNLDMLSELRKKRKIKSFFINMTVMRSNYKEMVGFAKLGIELGCDRVYFSKIFGDEYLPDRTESIFLLPETEIIDEIDTILSHPVFNQPQIDTAEIRGFVTALRNKDATAQ